MSSSNQESTNIERHDPSNSNDDRTDEQQPQQEEEPSYFNREWISNAVHEAVTHFLEEDQLESSSLVSCGALDKTCADLPSSSRSNAVVVAMEREESNQSLALLPRISRSLSSGAYSALTGVSSSVASLEGCGLRSFRCRSRDTNSALSGSMMTTTNSYQPYYAPSDFHSQTWLAALSDTISLKALAGGATAFLTAVVIIHPLVLATAAATAAVGATAMWAVGLFRNVEQGYAIWNADDFGKLFWEDAPIDTSTTCAINGANSAENVTSASVTLDTIAASVTTNTAAAADAANIKSNEKEADPSPQQQMMQQQSYLEISSTPLRVMRIKEEELSTLHNGQVMEKPHEQLQQLEGEHKKESWMKRRDFKMMKRKLRTHHLQQSLLDEIPSRASHALRKTHSAPVKPSPYPLSLDKLLEPTTSIQGTQSELIPPLSPTVPPISLIPKQVSIDRHFPPLEIQVVHEVKLPGLHTAEFFRVFFADDAPYSMKDFQKKWGDVDVEYGQWELAEEKSHCSFKKGDSSFFPLPAGSVRERTLCFNTLTKSYFGPAYAKATKVQRATQLSNNLLVIENETQLENIPFSDRFRVMERWIVEAVENENQNGAISQEGPVSSFGQDMALFTSILTVYSEVVMLKSCSWEGQIRKKASETVVELVTDWCESATKALKATEEQKQKRLKLSGDDTCSTAELLTNDSTNNMTSTQLISPTSEDSKLIARHRRNFQELDKLILNGDLEWCSVEVMHSYKAGTHAAFAHVLESPQEEGDLSKALTDETDATNSTDDSPDTPPIIRKRNNQRFLKRLSSKLIKSTGHKSKSHS